MHDARSRVLVLGSMPGPEALRRRQYYGFPGNHFWRLMAELRREELPGSYRERIGMLRRGRIALWDALRSCTRDGALDSNIRGERPNDIAGLLRRRPRIRAVLLNGRKAEQVYRRHFKDRIGLPALYLPSTSPANAVISYDEKVRRWRAALRPWLDGPARHG